MTEPEAALRQSLGRGTDWAWRPALWHAATVLPVGAPPSGTGLAAAVTMFHDCRAPELALRQLARAGNAPFPLEVGVAEFDGSFLSLVLDLPDAAVEGLHLRHLIRLEAQIDIAFPLKIFARLNIKHGPNTEQLTRALPPEGEVEFDLAYSKVNEKRIEKLWLDLIFEAPGQNRITLRDMVVSRRPRAAL